MSERRRILTVSIAIVVLVSICVTAASVGVLHRVSFERQRARLVEVVKHRAHILSEIRDFEGSCPGQEPLSGSATAALDRIVGVYGSFGFFGETGEFTVGRLDGDQIVWLLEHRHEDVERPNPTPLRSELAEPMRRALQGESGTIVELDYRSEPVLAAYEPIPELGWGVVAKIDIAEINGPFVTAGLLAAGIAAVVIAVGIAVMLRVESPLIGRIEARVVERTERLSEAIREQAHLQQLLRSATSEAALAEERERRKLAADLHDGLGQLLTLAAMKLGMLRDSVQDPELVSQVRDVETVIAEADERTSSLSFELSPPFLHDMGLVAAAQWLAEEIERRFGLHVAVESDEPRHPLSAESRITLFRALSEALQNVVRHAHADSASVQLGQEGGFMSISIKDDGVGFDPDAETGGYGLLSTRERLSHLGGRMFVESAPGQGTRIRLMMPLADTDTEADGVSS